MRIHLFVIPMLSCFVIQAVACELGEADRLYRTYDSAYLTMKSHDDESITEYMSDQAREGFRKGVEMRNSSVRGDDPPLKIPAGADPGKNLLLFMQGIRGRVPENAELTVSGDEGNVKIEYSWTDEYETQIFEGYFITEIWNYIRDVELICRDKWLVNYERQIGEMVYEKRVDHGVVKSEGAGWGGKSEWYFPP